jgi:hypothetical protein
MKEEQKLKLCKDCKNFNYILKDCKKQYHSIVTGEPFEKKICAVTARNNEYMCGCNAQYFEQKEEKEEKVLCPFCRESLIFSGNGKETRFICSNCYIISSKWYLTKELAISAAKQRV